MKGDHVVIDLVRECLSCNHCHETIPLKLPMDLSKVNRLGQAFLLNHLDCKPTEVTP